MLWSKSEADITCTFAGILSRSTAPGSAGAAAGCGLAGAAAEAAGGAVRGGGATGVVAMTRISGSLTALESAVAVEFCCAAAGAIDAAIDAIASRP